MKLEPTEAQRKAIIGFLSRPYPHYDPYKPDYEGWLDAFLAAANSIPEGPPVDTIARRPDGIFLAVRKAESSGAMYWQYWAPGGARIADGMPQPDDADSWPQIRPDQWPDQSGLDWFPPGEEPLVPRPDPTDREPWPCRICNGSGIGYGKVPGGWLETDCAACDATGEAQQEPGESLARGLDDIATGRVSRRDDYLEPQQEPCCGVSEVFDCDCPPAVRGTVEDALRPDDVKLLETDPMEFVRRTQQEPTTTHSVSPESTNCVPTEVLPDVG